MSHTTRATSRRAFLGTAAAAAVVTGVRAEATQAATSRRAPYRERHRVDVHGHSLVPAYRAALTAAGISAFHRIPVPDWSPQLALAFMDQHDIAFQFLSVSDPGVSFLADDVRANALARAVNDQVAAVVQAHPKRFGAFGVVNLRDVAAATAEAARCLDTLKLDGVGLLTSAEGRYLGDPVFAPLLTALNARGAWVMVHPTQPPADDKPDYSMPDFVAEYPFDTTRAIVSLLFNGALTRWPRIRWHFAHGGGCIPMIRSRLSVLAANAKPFGAALGLPSGSRTLTEQAPERLLRRQHYDVALIADPPELEAVDALAGPRQMLFGSDWPFAARAFDAKVRDPAPALSAVFTADDRHRIDRRNARAAFPRLASIVPAGA